ncbi:MAG: hypothetical protein WD200_00970 [Candidatus Andersenbacteria bacterium]
MQSYFLTRGNSFLVGILFCLIAFLVPRAAFADPHALFYTTVGQQQLFFNTLAALDQADYVEPNTNRQELVQQRTATGFSETSDPSITATHTDLASILTRSITLEGQDLWTAYIQYQFALEDFRRDNTSALVTLFCERGLGVLGCKQGEEKNPKNAQLRLEAAYNSNPLAEEEYRRDAGNAALASGTAADQADRREILKGSPVNPNVYRPYSPDIAQLRSTANTSEKAAAVDRLVASATSSDGSVSTLFKGLEINGGRASLPPGASLDAYMSKMSAAISAPAQIDNIRDRAEAKAKTVNEEVNVDGALADVRPKLNVYRGTIGTIDKQIVSPAWNKKAEGEQAVAAAAVTETNSIYTDPNTGAARDQRLVKEGERSGVAGATTDKTIATGQVLAATDFPDPTPQPRTPINDPAAFFHEVPIKRFYSLNRGGNQRGGCQCSLDGIVSGFGNDILNNP